MGLTLVTKSNHRKATQGIKRVRSYDLSFSTKTGRFALTGEAASTLDIQNNGLSLLPDFEAKEAYMGVAPSEQSIMLKGRAGSKKARSFKSDTLRETLNEIGLTGTKFKLENVDRQETLGDVTYSLYKIVQVAVVEGEADEADELPASDEAESAEASIL